ncbi:hypothetical protein [Streptomyces triticisoli]|uniref:hypothetical protein n=1 Tax=Streptomyces triticisoli TaxID=2182797 RepID=UPI001300BEE2|nr:hypothetical protein [Streptomyces triticisoli]
MFSSGHEEDTRKVQTAVLGGPNGHLPLFLPYEKQAAARLRQEHGANAFTCGVLLGGCGKLLTLRACDDKKSHFAHRPPVRCSRTALGESSADHLYIGQAISNWLRSRGHSKVSVEYVRQKNARSDAIEIRFGSQKKRRLIHIQMARRSFTEWRADGERLAAPSGKPSTIRMYGPESQLAAYEVEASGHALRFRCETANGTRVVSVGTQLPGHQVEWTKLEHCRLVPAGIITPSLEETPAGIRSKKAQSPQELPRPAAERKQAPATPADGPALPLVPGRVAFTGATLSSEENGRSLYDADAQPLGSTVFRARISLPAESVVLKPHHVYVLTERAAVLRGPQDDDRASRWTLRAEGITRLTAGKAAEWELLKPPSPVPVEESPLATAASPAVRESTAPRTDTGTEKTSASLTAGSAAVTPIPDDRLAAELRDVLLKAAREGATVTWNELLEQCLIRAQDVSQERRLRLLTAVDAPRAETHRPLLSSLVTFSPQAQPNSAPPSFFRQVLLALGWPHWTDAARAADIWREHQQRLHRALRAASKPVTKHSDLPPARPGEEPRVRLRVILRYLDDQGAELPFLDLYRIMHEADHLVSRIGDPFLPRLTKDRLQHWRTVFSSRKEVPSLREQENREDPEQTKARDAEARRVFDGMVAEFRAARDAGDLVRAKRIRSSMGPVYALRLSPQDREAATGLVREFKQWVRDQEPKPVVDPSLRAIRSVLQDLGIRRAALTADELASALAEIDRLRHRLSSPLPEAEKKRLGRWRGNLRHRLQTKESNADDLLTPQDDSRAASRLDATVIRSLADCVRTILEDAARAGTTITWGELRRRMEGALPYLHPDDQGEILVAVDRNTSADEPLLSALVAGADLSPHGLYRHIRYSLGRPRVPDVSLEMHWRMEVFQAYQFWRHR